MTPTDAEFRAAGKTGAARNFPLSEQGWRWIARFNNIQEHLVPESWKFASNAYMLEYIERRAKDDAAK